MRQVHILYGGKTHTASSAASEERKVCAEPRTALPRTMAAVLIGPGIIVCIVSITAGAMATLATATAAIVDWKASKDAEKAEKAENESNGSEGAEAGAKLK